MAAPRKRRCPHVLHSAAQLMLSGPGAGRTSKLTPAARLACTVAATAAVCWSLQRMDGQGSAGAAGGF